MCVMSVGLFWTEGEVEATVRGKWVLGLLQSLLQAARFHALRRRHVKAQNDMPDVINSFHRLPNCSSRLPFTHAHFHRQLRRQDEPMV